MIIQAIIFPCSSWTWVGFLSVKHLHVWKHAWELLKLRYHDGLLESWCPAQYGAANHWCPCIFHGNSVSKRSGAPSYPTLNKCCLTRRMCTSSLFFPPAHLDLRSHKCAPLVIYSIPKLFQQSKGIFPTLLFECFPSAFDSQSSILALVHVHYPTLFSS